MGYCLDCFKKIDDDTSPLERDELDDEEKK